MDLLVVDERLSPQIWGVAHKVTDPVQSEDNLTSQRGHDEYQIVQLGRFATKPTLPMMPSRLQQIANGRFVAAAMVVWLGLSFAFFTFGPYSSVRTAGKQASLLEERFGYSVADAYQWFDQIGSDGRSAYQTFQILDFGNAIVTSIAMVLALTFSLSRLFGANRRIMICAYLPIAVGVIELIENTLLGYAVTTFPDQHVGLLRIASAVTTLKLVLAFCVLPLTALSLVILFIIWLCRGLHSPELATHGNSNGEG